MNVLATACNSRYFHSCATLIASIHRLSFDDVDKILVYNLGLNDREKEFLRNLQKVQVEEFKLDRSFFPGYLEPHQFAWKPYVIKDAGNFGDMVLYLDSGIIALKNIKCIYDIIDKEEIFIVGDSHLNSTWTHDKCFEILNATDKEKNDCQICAGIQGYKVNGKYQECYVDAAFEFSKIRDAVFGNVSNHRHDQSIFSILCSRYKLPRQDVSIYGERRGPDISPDQVLYVHKNSCFNFDGMITTQPV